MVPKWCRVGQIILLIRLFAAAAPTRGKSIEQGETREVVLGCAPLLLTMGPRLTLRSFVWGICLAIVLCAVRTARASAPMCDETATSRIAPPPVLPIRDVKFEAGFPCEPSPVDRAPVAVAPIGPRAPSSPAIHFHAVATEAWVRPVDAKILPPLPCRTPVPPDAPPAGKPGFTPSVFRPPRG